VRAKSRDRGEDDLRAVFSVIDETRLLFHRLKRLAEEVHRQGETSAGKRGVLMALSRLGPQTVPQMASARPVSRQHIQALVNLLRADGHVELMPNPAHKRSSLVRLTRKGETLAAEIERRERELFRSLSNPIPVEEMRSAARVLRDFRRLFEGEQWKRLMTDERIRARR
jgi:DNA-binding MarR family transcriptional regulator